MLAVRTYGPLNQTPIVFLHGILGCKEDWDCIAQRLEDTFYSICIDLPGHGSSSWQEDPVASLFQTLDSLDISSAIGVGYSLGGRILLEMQKQRPDFFTTLFFLGAHPGLGSAKEKEERKTKEEKWIKLLETEPIDSFLELWYAQPLFASLKSNTELFGETLKKRKRQDMRALLQMYKAFRLSNQEHFEHFPVRSIFFYGEYDSTYRDLYVNKNWHVEIEKISQSGHAIPIENPIECAHRIKSCLQLKIQM